MWDWDVAWGVVGAVSDCVRRGRAIFFRRATQGTKKQ